MSLQAFGIYKLLWFVQVHRYMHTRYSGRSSPLIFDQEIERTARTNRVATRSFNTMDTNEVHVEDVIEEQENVVNSPPPTTPHLPNNNNNNNNSQIVQPIQIQPNGNNRDQNNQDMGNWGYANANEDRNGWNINQNGGNRRNQDNNVFGGNANYNQWHNPNFNNGNNRNINDGFWNQGGQRVNPNGGFNNDQGHNGRHYNEGNNFPPLYFPPPNRQSVASHFQPGEYDDASPILFPEGNEHHVEIRPQLISVLPVFRGYKLDDPYNHLYEFLAIANANIPRGTNKDLFRLHLFPFTIKEKAKYWFTSLASGSITTWDQLKTKFLQEFYPASKTTEIRKAIQDFTQKPNEEFHDAFERLKELLRSCPHHEFPRWQLVRFFYDGVDSTHQAMINASSGGTIMMHDSEAAWRFLEQLSNGSKTNYSTKKRDTPISTAASVGLDRTWKNEVKSDFNALNKKFDLLLARIGKEKGAYVLQGQHNCMSCGDTGHTADTCTKNQKEISMVHGYGQFQNGPRPFNRPNNQGNWNNQGNQGNYNNNRQGNFQNPNQQRQFQQPIQNQGAGPSNKKEENEGNKLDKIMEFITQTYQKTDTNSKSIAAIEKQIAQIAEQIGKREEGKFPSNTTINPSHNQRSGKEHQVNQVITLRNGKKVDNKVSPLPLDNDSDVEIIYDEKEEMEKDLKTEKVKVNKGNTTSKVGEHDEINIAPYPSALETPASFPFGKRGPRMDDMWDLFSQVKINIPLVKLIKEVPSYAKFLKDLCIQKRKLQAHLPKKVELTEHASSIVSNTLPPKFKDPGAPLISVTLGNINVKKALLDLGASVNILPGNLFDQHDLGTLQQTDVILQLADKSTKIPRGVLSDVIVKVEDFYYPVDFLVLDTEKTLKESQPTIILGRPFLATINAQINCRTGVMDIPFGNRKLRIHVFNAFPNSPSDHECYRVDVVDDFVHQFTPKMLQSDPLELFLSCDRDEVLELEDIQMVENEFINAIGEGRPPWSHQFETLPTNFLEPLKPSLNEPPTLELKNSSFSS